MRLLILCLMLSSCAGKPPCLNVQIKVCPVAEDIQK